MADQSLDQSSRSAAWRAQNPSSSFAASSYMNVPATNVCRLNSSEGGNRRFSHCKASIPAPLELSLMRATVAKATRHPYGQLDG